MRHEAETHDELTRYRHSFVEFSGALAAAAVRLPSTGRGPNGSALVTGAMLAVSDDVDLLAIEWLTTLCALVVATKTGETPRSVFERKFASAPHDVDWRHNWTGEN